MVAPPALTAATPVGATTTTLFCVAAASSFSSVVLPVPAFPVTKECLRVCRTNCSASSNSELVIAENPFSVFGVEGIPEGPVAALHEDDGMMSVFQAAYSIYQQRIRSTNCRTRAMRCWNGRSPQHPRWRVHLSG